MSFVIDQNNHVAVVPDFDDEENDCSECNGRGYIYNYMKGEDDDKPLFVKCPDCRKTDEEE